MLKRQFQVLLAMTVISFALISSARAQEPSTPSISPSKRALIGELLVITEVKKTAAGIYQGFMEQQRKMSEEVTKQAIEAHPDYAQMSDEQKERAKTQLLEKSTHAERRMQELIEARINLTQIIEDIYYQLYDKYYTEQELKDLVDFYKSPTGRKQTAIIPKLLSESMELAAAAIQPKLQEVLTIFMKEESERLEKEMEGLKKEPSEAEPSPPKPRRSGRRRP